MIRIALIRINLRSLRSSILVELSREKLFQEFLLRTTGEEILSSLDESSCFESLPTPDMIKKSVARFFANQKEYPLGLYNGVNVVLSAYQLNMSDDKKDAAIKRISLALIDCAKGKKDNRPYLKHELREWVAHK